MKNSTDTFATRVFRRSTAAAEGGRYFFNRLLASRRTSISNDRKNCGGRGRRASTASGEGADRAEILSCLRALRRALTGDPAATAVELRGPGTALSEGDQPGHQTSQSSNISSMQRLSAAVAEVDAAIDRVENGVYGICTDCGMAIPGARLAVNPVAARCTGCQEKREQSKH